MFNENFYLPNTYINDLSNGFPLLSNPMIGYGGDFYQEIMPTQQFIPSMMQYPESTYSEFIMPNTTNLMYPQDIQIMPPMQPMLMPPQIYPFSMKLPYCQNERVKKKLFRDFIPINYENRKSQYGRVPDHANLTRKSSYIPQTGGPLSNPPYSPPPSGQGSQFIPLATTGLNSNTPYAPQTGTLASNISNEKQKGGGIPPNLNNVQPTRGLPQNQNYIQSKGGSPQNQNYIQSTGGSVPNPKNVPPAEGMNQNSQPQVIYVPVPVYIPTNGGMNSVSPFEPLGGGLQYGPIIGSMSQNSQYYPQIGGIPSGTVYI